MLWLESILPWKTYLGGCFDVMVGGHIDMETYLGGCFDVMVGGWSILTWKHI